MDTALEEAAKANDAIMEKVVALLNSIALDPFPFCPNSSNP